MTTHNKTKPDNKKLTGTFFNYNMFKKINDEMNSTG